MRSYGFTLIESLVALSIAVLVLLGPVTLATFILPRTAAIGNEIIAINLAQEGLELVRAIRENNILCDFLDGPPVGSWEWDHHPNTGGDMNTPPTGRRVSVGDTDAVSDPACGGIITPSLLTGSVTQPLRRDAVTATYSYDSADPATIFSRSVVINVPPTTPDGGSIPNDHQMDVTSTVTWTERGQTRTEQMFERFYYWR